jgi:hypothetical protein
VGEIVSLGQTLINTLINSIPEEIFITMIILKYLKVYGYYTKERLKENLTKVLLVSVIPMAILSNTLTYAATTLHIETLESIKPIIGILVTALTIVKLSNKKFKTALWTTVKGFAFFMLTEMITFLIAKYGLQIDLNTLNESAYFNFILFFPERFVQYGILIFTFKKQNSMLSETKTIEMLKEAKKIIDGNKLVSNIIFCFNIISITFLMIVARLIVFDHILEKIPIKYQLIIVVTFLTMPLLVPLGTWLATITILNQRKYNEEYGKEVKIDEEQDS